MNIGIAISTFSDGPEQCIELARSADLAGIDGVFVYDHLLGHTDAGAPRSSMEAIALLGALAVETRTAALGALVIRSGIRPAPLVAESIRTVNEISGGRVVLGVGTGDSQSAAEDAMFGIHRGDGAQRRRALEATVSAIRRKSVPVWVGGRSREACAVAAECADGLNIWGTSPDRFREVASTAAALRAEQSEQSDERGPFMLSWAGLVDVSGERSETLALGHNDVRLSGSAADIAAELRPYRDGGAGWIILAPLPPFAPEAVDLIVQVKQELLLG